jgi:hypothetical protein
MNEYSFTACDFCTLKGKTRPMIVEDEVTGEEYIVYVDACANCD